MVDSTNFTRRLFLAAALLAGAAVPAFAQDANTLYLDLKDGRVTILEFEMIRPIAHDNLVLRS